LVDGLSKHFCAAQQNMSSAMHKNTNRIYIRGRQHSNLSRRFLMFDDVVIVAAGRTAVGAFNGALAGIPASQLGAHVIKALLARANLQPGPD
jgi:hypothetical protein